MATKKVALITGITGQDGSYLAELLLSKGYMVHGIRRRASSFNTQRIDHLFKDPLFENENLSLHYGDLTDSSSLTRILEKTQPDEIYNLAAQSHVAVSFEVPEYTADVVAVGTLRLLESMRLLRLTKKTRFYQASSSEMYGKVRETPQDELTPFHPRSPYAVSKVFAYWTAINYRESYGIHACNGILFNHESPRRGENFVTKKITRGLTNISQGLEKCLYMGNLDAMRDWGHAEEYAKAQWLILQHEVAEDFCIATGEQYSVRQFIEWSGEELGIKINFKGEGLSEVGVIDSIEGDLCPALKEGDIIVRINERYFRPAEVNSLQGNSSKAKKVLGWEPKISAKNICKEMISEDLKKAQGKALLIQHGHDVSISSD